MVAVQNTQPRHGLRHAPRPILPGRTVVVRRTNSLGDVVAATAVADELFCMGYQVEFQAHANCHPLLRMHPTLRRFTKPNGEPTINLDNAYELHPQRKTISVYEIYHGMANRHLATYGIAMPDVCNWAPRLICKDNDAIRQTLEQHPKPWVMIVPRSNSWVNKTVPDEVWFEAATGIKGTAIWLGNHAASPPGILDAQCRTVEQLAGWLNCADLVVTTDTGPAHIALAFKTPALIIGQAVEPAMFYPPQRDWAAIYPADLDCLNCRLPKCPLDASHPPCQNISPAAIADAVNRRLGSLPGHSTVSAIIAVYKPDVTKLNRCLKCVLPQVDEAVVCGDLDTPWPIDGLLNDPKIIRVRLPATKTGYGKKSTFGARHSNGTFLHQLNDDVYLGPNVIGTLMGEMKQDVGIVTHTLRYLDGTIQYAGKHRPRGERGFGHLDHRAKKSRYNSPVEEESGCGASMFIRREAFFQADGFDERYFLYSEDDDLAMTVRQNGWRVIFTPHAEGLHEEHCSTSITPGWMDIMNESNRKFVEKWKFYFDKNSHPNRIGTFK